MEQNKQNRRHAWMVIALYLLLVAALSVPMTVSKFESTASAEDSAVIAAFEVAYDEATEYDVNGDPVAGVIDLSGKMSPGDTKTYWIKVSNHSDVKVSYRAKGVTYGILPLQCTFQKATEPAVSQATGTLEYEGYEIWQLTVTWPSAENESMYAGQIDAVKVVVDFEQVN